MDADSSIVSEMQIFKNNPYFLDSKIGIAGSYVVSLTFFKI